MTSTLTQISNPAQSSDTSSAWVRFRSVAYLRGRGLSYGVGGDLYPREATAYGKYSIGMDPQVLPNATVVDNDFSIFSDDSFDHVVVGKHLELSEDPGAIIRTLTWKLKLGGHMVIYLPYENPDPRIKFKFDQNSVDSMLRGTGAWRIKGQYVRDGRLLTIAKRIIGHKGTVVPAVVPKGHRACIVRYGALGDMVILTPLIRQLHEDGYDVTMNMTPYALPILENNPYISNYIIQEREAIPNSNLGAYWNEWQGEYDKYINLSESLEGALLKVEGRRDFFMPQAWRHEKCNQNYSDYTMALGGYPESTGHRGELFFTKAESREAQAFRKEHEGKFIVIWALNGSSHHKVYPLMEDVIREWLDLHPETIFITVGDSTAQLLEFSHPCIINAAGVWSIRKVLALLPYADCVIGPESMVANAAACFDVPKITFLSHSTHENLCKHWTNDLCLTPDSTFAPCYPCHQLHYTAESCPTAEVLDEQDRPVSHGPRCVMGAISPERVLARMEQALALTTCKV